MKSTFNKNEKIKQSTLPFKATGTTNYLLSEFNDKTKERNILFEGGVPLHKIVYNLYDFFHLYLHRGNSPDKYYYISVILKPEPDCRPETPVLLKLRGDKSKKIRNKQLTESIDKMFQDFDTIFEVFINSKTGMRCAPYRKSDTPPVLIQRAQEEYHKVSKEKILKLTQP